MGAVVRRPGCSAKIFGRYASAAKTQVTFSAVGGAHPYTIVLPHFTHSKHPFSAFYHHISIFLLSICCHHNSQRKTDPILTPYCIAKMRSPAHLLPQLAPAIDKIASLSGVPGVSVGVIHDGHVVFRYNYGHGDVAAKTSTTSDTIYPIASLSKSFTAFLYASLVHDGLADWSTPIREILPDFHSASSEVSMEATPVDLISHRTGIAGGESLYWHGQPLLNDSDIIPVFGSQPSVHRFRTGWMYNNLGYAIVGLAMIALSGQTYSELFQSRIARPLGLDRTGLAFDQCESCDVAKAYLTTEDGTPFENENPLIPAGTAMVAAGAIRSSVNDLLVFYGSMLRQLGATADPDPSQYSLRGLPIITSANLPCKTVKSLCWSAPTLWGGFVPSSPQHWVQWV